MTAKERERRRRKRIRYPRSHTLARKEAKPYVEAGATLCTRCHERILPGEEWDLDHRDDGPGYRGPSHARCNRQAGARKRWDTGPGPSRDWLS